MKRIKAFLVIVALFLCATVSGHDFYANGIYYSITSSEDLTVQVSYQGSNYSEYSNEYSGNVIIPTKVIYDNIEYNVTSIGEYAFAYCNITSVSIPISVTDISEYAFSHCTGLKNISIPNTVTVIGRNAFEYCSSLTSVEIPNSVNVLDSNTFYRCSGLTNVKIPNSVVSIGGSAFEHCSSLTNIDIPQSVTSIGRHAFYYCTELKTVTIPNSVTNMEDGVFMSCSSLNNIVIPNSVTSIKDATFYDCSELTNISIPESITSIGSSVFYGCSKMKSIIIPNSVTTMGNTIFERCSELTSVTLPDSLGNIGTGMFDGCANLTDIIIPSTVKEIGSRSFKNCRSLTNIIIPNSVVKIGNSAFEGCSALEEVIIGNSVTSINDLAFGGCSDLKRIEIPNSVTYLGGSVFYDCSNLQEITIGNSVTSIGLNAFSGCSKLINVNIPNSVKSIGSNAFVRCSSLTKIDIPNSVTSIGSSAFEGCTSMTNITIGNSVTSIERNAFKDCSTVNNISMPNSVTAIGNSAFENCSSLTSIYIPDSVTSIGARAFSGCLALASIEVSPNNVVYDSRKNCNAIIERRSSNLIAGCKNTVIPDSIMTIGDYAFEGHTELTSINIPNSVKNIGNYVFNGCTKLTDVRIGMSVENIGNYAFDNCLWLKNVTCYASFPPTFGSFREETFEYANLYVPDGSKSTYATTTGWSSFGNIQEISLTPTSDIASFIINSSTVSPGDPFVLPIEMKNDSIMTAFQCDIYLPEGMTLQMNNKGKYDITLDSERCDDHSISSALQSDGSVRVVVMSMTTAPISGTEGVLFNIGILAAEELGTYTIDIKNINVSDAAGNLYYLANVSGTIDVYFKPGDANGDGTVAVNDAVYTVNKILGAEAADFKFRAADMNNDGNILVNDVVLIVNTILGINTTTASLAPRYVNAYETLSVTDSKNNYVMAEFGVSLSNAGRYTAIQFDMQVADAADVTDIRTSSSATNHNVAFRMIDDTTVRVVVTSLTNEALADGTQLCVSMKNTAGSSISFINGKAACNNGQMVDIMPSSSMLSGTTGINGINADFSPVDIYDLTGKIVKKGATSLDGLKRGVYVINGQKIIK